MATDDDSPRAIIGNALARNPEAIVNTSIELLELLANGLIGIIGEQGFDTLLYRSVHRVNLEYPWMMFDPRSRPADPEFHLLRACFEDQDVVQTRAASTLLFDTFIDILGLLIGEHLTMLILHAALGRRGGAAKNSKEQHNG
ncbi:MAG: hypothetical protein QFF03_23495 [Pseudomonadota bacterium]|nr:hypothetical protein [Pseudomonadota bacterium]